MKEVTKWEDMRVKYPEDRDKMSDETHRAFLDDCYKLYEKEGFHSKFWTPYSDYESYIDSSFTVIRQATEDDGIFIECLPMWLIKFEDGKEIFAYPEEIILSDMKANGYRN